MTSCSSSERADIVFDSFENDYYEKWNKLGSAFFKPVNIDSLDIPLQGIHGKYVAFSNFEAEGKDKGLGKLVSKIFTINRKYINLLIAGGKHKTRQCINLIIDNKIVKVANGKNDYFLRPITWDVSLFEGKKAVIEIVDAIATSFDDSLEHVAIDHIVFSDNEYEGEFVFDDFESGTYNNWVVEGNAFVSPRNRTNVYYPLSVNGFKGAFFAFSFGDTHDVKKGKLTSKPFKIEYDYMKFLVGGGNHKKKTCINFIINGSIIFSSQGENDGQMRKKKWDLRPYKGQIAEIEIVDSYSGGWGHIMVDDIIFYNNSSFYSNFWFWIVSVIIVVFVFEIVKKTLKIKKNQKTKQKISLEDINILEKIKRAVVSSKLYKKPTLTIDDISNALEINVKNIDSLFEKTESISFSHYLNCLRVEEFKRQLKNSKNKDYTMVWVAKNCGFNSKTSFYRAFKAVTNTTPSDYKKTEGLV